MLGAVYMPLATILPLDADQVTAVLLVPETEAENCCCAPVCKLAAVGETETWMLLTGGGADADTVTTADPGVTANPRPLLERVAFAVTM